MLLGRLLTYADCLTKGHMNCIALRTDPCQHSKRTSPPLSAEVRHAIDSDSVIEKV